MESGGVIRVPEKLSPNLQIMWWVRNFPPNKIARVSTNQRVLGKSHMTVPCGKKNGVGLHFIQNYDEGAEGSTGRNTGHTTLFLCGLYDTRTQEPERVKPGGALQQAVGYTTSWFQSRLKRDLCRKLNTSASTGVTKPTRYYSGQ
ncbi:hypothetical protein, unlikely [Trypanosoma brucei gambiense DAL972]|uniref:Uncharacterized protein n=1 Tax=Trypanosoma brucei gambiense (strain MHOM/CI/86/DAL972) TaxID=679716 RepID=C9ZPZ3_TRYB9|nr:hypothetical protein, unlikely [Trypanosoma brucei gambiense DAL972]CBH11471.1 hypothetical protein, unlikely [Trypanosoma brucei gambiense DAL972]|eukprot:XP_011773758.1 hypothetical protein, unlikely [Trypanosoma brucei gambiense DAL972]